MSSDRRSPCPVACTLDLIGDKWTLLIIRDLYLGKQHFGEFQQSPEGIATNILTNRLSRLLDAGLVEKYPSPQHSRREAYRLTEKGKSLLPIVKAIMKWGLKHVEGTSVNF